MATFSQAVGACTVHLIESGPLENYIYVVEGTDECLIVDPAEASPVIDLLSRCDLEPAAILVTHDDHDHVAGIGELKQRYRCTVIGPPSPRIDGLDREVCEGDLAEVGSLRFEVLDTPGHVVRHLTYLNRKDGFMFCGDSLFSGGCGRLNACPPEVMWKTLCRLRELPPETQVFCGHEYTEQNLRFALSILPRDPALIEAMKEVRIRRAEGQPSLPSSVGRERQMNLFLRSADPDVRAALNLAEASGERVFATLRRRKDRFR